jgi:hypothetical protein
VKKLGVLVVMAGFALAAPISFGDDYNSLVLEQIKQMPRGGRYSVSRFAKIRLQSSAHFESGKFFILPSQASPSFCSGATYLVFIRTIESLRARGQLRLEYSTLERLIIREQRDGEGIWGRWNANGPGTARLFHELQLGQNFDNFDRAKPGDFMKIFWSRQVGRNEHGHSTIFLGMRIVRTASMCATGRAIFRLATARKAFREARLPMPFFRVFRRLKISRGSTTPHL